ncbi:MAG: penicillin-binding protein 2 [Nitrospirota bacterium]
MKRRAQWRCNEEWVTRQFFRRLLGVAVILSGMALVVGWRLVDLQIVQAAALAKRAERQQERMIPIEAERGAIYDRQGRVVAMSSELPSLFAVPSAIDHPAALGAELAAILERPRQELVRRLSADRPFVWLDRQVAPARAQAVLALGSEGIGVVVENRRFYPKRALMGHLIGFAGLDHQGLEGLELSYDHLLRGERGWLLVERDAAGRAVFPKSARSAQPAKGRDLRLTVDEVIQYSMEQALDAALRQTEAASAIAVMMEPRSGAILGMAVRPEFNPNQAAATSAERWRNRAITDLYEPGSTIKPLILAGALEDRKIRLDELIDCEQGSMLVANRRLRDHLPHGLLTPPQIIQVSSNVGAAKIGMQLGAPRLRHWLTEFGLDRPTGIDLKGEAGGLLRPVAQWSGRSLASHAIGQELAITPMQLVAAYAALANGGLLVTPHLVDAAVLPDGTRQAIERPAARRVISRRTADRLRDILVSVTAPEGTAPKAAIPGFRVAGKTGTAQKIDPETRRYDPREVISSFIGFVPAESPQFVLLVIIDGPQGAGWGGVVAAPVFRQIAEETLHYLGVMPQAPMVAQAAYVTPHDVRGTE